MKKKLVLLYLAAFLGPFGSGLVFPILNTLSDSFNTSLTMAGLSVTLFMLPFVAIQLFSGALFDLYNRKNLMLSGFFIYTLGSIICLLAFDIYVFLFGRAVQGIGGGLVAPSVVAFLGQLVDDKKRGKIMGGLASAITFGTSTGPLISGIIAEYNWRFVFLILIFVSISLFFLYLSQFNFSENREKRDNTLKSQIKEALGNRNVIYLCISGIFVFICFIGAISTTSVYLSSEFDFSESKVGIVLSSAGFAGIVAGPIAGFLIDKIGRKITPAIGVGFAIVSVSLLTIADKFVNFLIFFALLGCAASFVNTTLNTMSVEVIPTMRGTTASLYSAFRFFGYAIAPLILLPIYSFSVEVAYLFCGGSMVLAFFFILNIEVKIKS